MKPKADYPPFPNTPRWLAHDLLQILRGADLFCPEPYPLWVKHSSKLPWLSFVAPSRSMV
jgi:hypothetical protein